jgi:RNA polymerase sigma factor (sigma-70 family)
MTNIDMEKIYNEYFKVVYKYLICLTYNQEIAEDLTQETFCKAIKNIRNFQENCKISVWLCQIAKNLWLNELKKNKKILVTNIESIELIGEENIEEDFLNREDLKGVYKRISLLDEPMKNIIYLKLIGNLTFKEIGEVMRRNEVWARVNFYRAKQKLKEVEENGKRL